MMFAAGCASIPYMGTQESCVFTCFRPLPSDVQSILGVECLGFEAYVPEGCTLTVWSEFYQFGKLNEDLSMYDFIYNSPQQPRKDKLRTILFRRDPDFFTGETTEKAVWGFSSVCTADCPAPVLLKGILLSKDPEKTSNGGCKSNHVEEYPNKSLRIFCGKPHLLYYGIYNTNGKFQRYADKSATISNNNHAVFIYAQLDKGKSMEGIIGGGYISCSKMQNLLQSAKQIK